MELMIVILIIGLLAGLLLAALGGAVEQARESRTKSIINKLDQLILAKYESYRTRRLPIRTTGVAPAVAASARLAAMRELMRMELPDRRTDVVNLTTYAMEGTATGMPQAALQRTYYNKALAATGNLANWTRQHEGSECLLLIVSAMHDGDKNALDFFSEDEIGDVDGDGMREILDGWGNPIAFLRWAPAYTVENGVLTQQSAAVDTHGNLIAPDAFDPVRADPRWSDMTSGNEPFYLKPLIFSPGRDESYDVATILEVGSVGSGNDFRFTQTTTYGSSQWNDPYFVPPMAWSQFALGTVGDIDGDGSAIGWADNITNHYQEPQ